MNPYRNLKLMKYPGIKRKFNKLERERINKINAEPSITELAWCTLYGMKPNVYNRSKR